MFNAQVGLLIAAVVLELVFVLFSMRLSRERIYWEDRLDAVKDLILRGVVYGVTFVLTGWLIIAFIMSIISLVQG